MGVSSSAGPERLDAGAPLDPVQLRGPGGCADRRPGAALGTGREAPPLAGHGLSSLNHRELVRLILLAGGGLIVVLAAVILMGSFARRLSKDISGLAVTARHLADQQLPQFVERLRDGEQAARGG